LIRAPSWRARQEEPLRRSGASRRQVVQRSDWGAVLWRLASLSAAASSRRRLGRGRLEYPDQAPYSLPVRRSRRLACPLIGRVVVEGNATQPSLDGEAHPWRTLSSPAPDPLPSPGPHHHHPAAPNTISTSAAAPAPACGSPAWSVPHARLAATEPGRRGPDASFRRAAPLPDVVAALQVGQVIRCPQERATDEDRHHADVAVRRTGQLQVNIVIRLEQTRFIRRGLHLDRACAPAMS
jgi:hypothetical protein